MLHQNNVYSLFIGVQDSICIFQIKFLILLFIFCMFSLILYPIDLSGSERGTLKSTVLNSWRVWHSCVLNGLLCVYDSWYTSSILFLQISVFHQVCMLYCLILRGLQSLFILLLLLFHFSLFSSPWILSLTLS